MSQEGEGPHSDDNEPSKELKDKSKLFLHLQILKGPSCDINQCSLVETVNVNKNI